MIAKSEVVEAQALASLINNGTRKKDGVLCEYCNLQVEWENLAKDWEKGAIWEVNLLKMWTNASMIALFTTL